jgi:N-acetylneuraminate lyase
VGAVAPNFFKPSSLTDLVDYCAELASAVPKLPFYYYHIPSMTSIEFAMAEFLRLADKSIPNLGGIKFTFENLLDYALCVQFDDFKYNILFGRDEILLSGLALGASCAVGSFYNYLIPVFKDIIKAFGKGDIYKAQRLQYWVQRFTKIYLKYGGNIATGKAMMKIAGLDCGPVRQPMKSLSEQQLKSLKTELADIGYHKYSVKIDPS